METTPRPPLRRTRRCALAAWAAFGLSVALLWAEHRLGVLHPWSHLFLLLLVVTVAAALAGAAGALWRAGRGPGRRAALGWGLVCLLPLALWAALGAYLLHLARSATGPRNLLANTGMMAVASVMDLQARYGYPHRIE